MRARDTRVEQPLPFFENLLEPSSAGHRPDGVFSLNSGSFSLASANSRGPRNLCTLTLESTEVGFFLQPSPFFLILSCCFLLLSKHDFPFPFFFSKVEDDGALLPLVSSIYLNEIETPLALIWRFSPFPFSGERIDVRRFLFYRLEPPFFDAGVASLPLIDSPNISSTPFLPFLELFFPAVHEIDRFSPFFSSGWWEEFL